MRMADFDSEGDDAAFRRASDNHRKAAISYAQYLHGERIKAALATRKRKGGKLGRPRKLNPELAELAVAEMGGAAAAARKFGVSRSTLYEALARLRKKKPSGKL